MIAGAIIVGRDDLPGMGLTVPTLLNGILSLDHKLYRENDPLDAGTLEQWEPIFSAHPDTWRALVKDRTVLGYWQVAPLKPAMFDAMIAGTAHACDLCGSDYEDLRKPGRYPLYFVSVCLDEIARTPAHQFALVSSFLQVRARLKASGASFSRVAAHVHSPDGHRLCEVLGLQPAQGVGGRHPLFVGSLDRALKSFKGQLAERRFTPRIERSVLAA